MPKISARPFPYGVGSLRTYVRVPLYICKLRIFFATRSFRRLRLLKSLALAYISMYSCKNVLLRLGPAKARAGGTAFFEEYMRYPHGLRLFNNHGAKLRKLQKNAEKFAYVRFLL